MTEVDLRAEVERLTRRLDVAEQTVRALTSGEVDTVASEAGTTPVLLRSAQDQLRDSERLLRAVFDGAVDAMMLFDDDGVFRDVNDAACELFGRSRDELIGHVGADYYVETFDVRSERRRLHEHGHVRGELQVRRPDGAVRSVEFNSKTGIVPGLHLSIFRDVSERKKADEILRQTEQQLRQAQKMEAIGALAGGVAHDFNNLLSVILSYAGIVLSELEPGTPLRADIEEIRRAGVRAADLTRQLLAFGRRQVREPLVLDLYDVVCSVERMLSRLLGEDIELSIYNARSTPCVFADPGQIEQILMNLAVNARDAMPRGGKLMIEISTTTAGVNNEHGINEGRYVVVTVSDTGIGMDAATRDRIFEPFFTTKDPGKGTGLGLATVFGIVKQSDGHITVTSAPERGTTFKIFLPATTETMSSSSSPPAPHVSIRGTETILLVEDDPQVRAATGTTLRRHGYHVIDAQNGGEAFLLCEQHSEIHLLLTDVVMPHMSGRELAKRLVAMRPKLRVLYVSGYAEESVVHGGVVDPGIEFLQKPLTPATLLRKVRDVLDADTSSPQVNVG